VRANPTILRRDGGFGDRRSKAKQSNGRGATLWIFFPQQAVVQDPTQARLSVKEGEIHNKKDGCTDLRDLFVSRPLDDGRLPTYSCVTHPFNSDCSSFSASGDDDMLFA